MAASSAPAVKKKLLELLQAEAALKEVLVTYEYPSAIQQEMMYYNRTIETETAVSLGAFRRDEDYTVELIVAVFQDGDNGQIAEERCWAIIAVVENLLRANLQMGGTIGTGYIEYAGAEMTPLAKPGQRLAEAICRIHVVNRK